MNYNCSILDIDPSTTSTISQPSSQSLAFLQWKVKNSKNWELWELCHSQVFKGLTPTFRSISSWLILWNILSSSSTVGAESIYCAISIFPRANVTTFEALKICLGSFFQNKIKIGLVFDNKKKFYSSCMIFCTFKNPLDKKFF